jgi:hypothetical protein
MKLFLSIVFTFFLFLNTFSQTKEEVLRDAEKSLQAALSSDFKTVIKHTYPSIVKLMGGEEKAISLIEKTFDDMKKNQGFKFEKSAVISVSEIVKEQNQYRCFLKNNSQMVINNQRIKRESYLLGIYNEVDKFWFFIEAKQLLNTSINSFLPDFKTELVIPEGKMTSENI